MSKDKETTKSKPKNPPKDKEKLDMILNNNSESYLILKQKKIKIDRFIKKKVPLNCEEIENSDEDVPCVRTRKRSDSVDLYKKHKREKEKKNKKENLKNSKINNSNIYDVQENANTRKPNKCLKNGKEKKVSFPKNFVTIIDVESYKKFNEENTCKDPLDDLEFLTKIKDEAFKNKLDEIDEGNDGKERVYCSCSIY